MLEPSIWAVLSFHLCKQFEPGLSRPEGASSQNPDPFPRPSLHSTPWGYYNRSMISNIKQRALHRAKILEGQMRGVQKMIENEDYCMNILTQSLAIQKSISSLNKLILENHVRTHIKENLSSGSDKDQEKAVEELLGLYELSNVRSK